VLFYVLFVCKCVLPPGDNPIAVNKYIISLSYHIFRQFQCRAMTRARDLSAIGPVLQIMDFSLNVEHLAFEKCLKDLMTE